MKFFIFSFLLAMLAACVVGTAPTKSVLISADSAGVIDHAIQWIEDQEGVVLHKYTLIHAFLASAPASVFEKAKDTFTTNNWGDLVMEEDQEVHAWNEGAN
ncbi:Yhr138c-like protein [Lasiodiplodia theobromae]|uniref:Inhibitor I9 domain-containing protein n=1 Tax=Lasiodiplodia theobromae TaxID=45133 RepID=A0A5N5D5Z9_9PEZI|nr:Yhr138c-like protein [Lasiodiplodia theobromae]KAB2573027.1 hypothetical protein DBV05_g8320 [Lasiodiplodia theobromae]KAF4544483.1 Yhr138c-like protein [Lasiodiplodia theobromae]